MEPLLTKLKILKVDEHTLKHIRYDMSLLANHFIAYNDINTANMHPNSIEKINNLFPYPKYDVVEGALTCIYENGSTALLEMLNRIDPQTVYNMEHIREYILYYVSSDIPFAMLRAF